MELNLRIKEIITDRGIKQAYISRKTGLSNDVVSRILNGTRKMTGEELLLICDLLDVDPRKLRNSA